MPTKLKIALKLLGGSVAAILNTIITNLQMAAILAVLSALFFVWGIGDVLGKMKFYREGAMPTSNQSFQYDKSAKTTILVTAGLIFVIIAMLIHGVFWYRDQYKNAVEQIKFVKAWYFWSPSRNIIATFDGSALTKFYPYDKAMIACRLPDARIDAMDDSIEKSNPHDVTSGDITIQVDVSEMMQRVKPGKEFAECRLALLPKGVLPDGFNSLRKLKNLGGVILDIFQIGLLR